MEINKISHILYQIFYIGYKISNIAYKISELVYQISYPYILYKIFDIIYKIYILRNNSKKACHTKQYIGVDNKWFIRQHKSPPTQA